MSSISNENRKIVKAAATGIISAITINIVLTLIFAFIIKMISGIPYSIIDYAMVGAGGISILIGSYIAGAIAKSKGLILGAVCSAVMLIIILACGLSSENNDIGILTVIKSAVILICGIIGGIAGVNRKEKVRIK